MSWWSGKTNAVDLSLFIYASPPQPTCVSSSGRKSTGSPAPKPQDRSFPLVIPEIDIWRAAILMLRRYGDNALEESATRADQLAREGDPEGAATWRWIARAIEQLANTTPPGPVH